MEYLQSRIKSFSLANTKTKRSKASSSKQTSSSKWPHPASFKATPDSLAEAGFYYDPDSDHPDNVTCFMCKKNLGGWEPDDDPFAIHYEKCRNTCSWAVVRCQMGLGDKRVDTSDPTRDPTSAYMQKARLDTFTKNWPHDTVEGHGANSQAMAKAGFLCNALEPGDDTAICLYCDLVLGGWDADDDPYQEHLKRRAKSSCAFLKAYAGASLNKSTAKRPSSRTASKPPCRKASQSSRGASGRDTDMTPAEDSDDELAVTPSDASQPPKQTTGRQSKASSARASSVAAKTPASRRSTRGTSGTGKTSGAKTVSSEVEETDAGSESDVGKRPTKSKKKIGGRTKTRVSAIAEEAEVEPLRRAEEDVKMEDPEGEQADDLVAGPQPVKKKRGRPPKSTTTKVVSQENVQGPEAEEEAPPDAETGPQLALVPPAKKTNGRTRSKATLESSEAEVALRTSKSTHTRTKSASKAKSKREEETADEEVLGAETATKKRGKLAATKVVPREEEEDEAISAQPKKPKGKAVARSKANSTPHESDGDDAVAEPSQQTSRTRVDSGRSHSSKGSKSSLSEDAGYATAEQPLEGDQMDVDDKPVEHVLPPVKKQDPPVHARPTSQMTVDSNGGKRNAVVERVRSSSIASSSRASSVRPPSRLNQDSLKVIEIDSDGEDTGVYGTPAPAQIKAPLARAGSTNGVQKKPTSQMSRSKLQVEILVPPPPPKTKASPNGDVQMRDLSPRSPIHPEPASATTKPASRPSTPVSAIHRSAPPSPIPQTDAPDDVQMPDADPDEEVVAPAPSSPRTYHPYLAQFPMEKLTALTDEEADMTLEQYIRREMELQYAQMKADAERRIEQFKQKAAETRKLIETS